MQREEINSQEILSSDQLEERYSIDQDCQDQQEIEQVLISDSKIEELHRSVDRLREFITALPEQQVTLVPTCVEEYCDKMTKYHVQNGQEVLQMAERRVNKMLRNRKIKRNWNSEDITLLVWLVSQRLKIIQPAHFSQMSKQDWDFISNMISGSTWQKCKFKWLSLKKVKLVTHKWTKGESKILSEAIAQQDKINWKVVSERLYERNSSKTKVFRTAKQCREHWNCFLNPTIQKGPWTLQEDHRLLEFVLELQGSKKWSQIAKFMEGRTQNALKNRFNLLVGRQRKTSGHLTEKRLIKICLSKLMLQEKQQRPSLSNIQSLDLLREQKRQEEERPRSQRQEDKKTSTMPTIPSPLYHQSQLSFANSYENLVTIFNNNVESIGGSMISSPVGTPNTMFFGFVFPNQF